MKRVLVTGAAGFLGSHVIENLLERNYQVQGIDNLEWGTEANISLFSDHNNFEFKKVDICDQKNLDNTLESFKPDICIHLAALHFIPDCINNPSKTIFINVYGTQVLLDGLKKHACKTIWFASTGDVYKPTEERLREDSIQEPFNIYGQSKYLMEKLIKYNYPEDGSFIIGRLFNLYGSRETNPHILPEIISQLKANKEAVLRLGNLYPKRDMVPIKEAAKAIIESCEKVSIGCHTMNFATGNAVSMQELIDMMGEVMGKPINVETDPSKVRTVERPHLEADVSLLKGLIGWAPSSNLKSGVKELLKDEGLA